MRLSLPLVQEKWDGSNSLTGLSVVFANLSGFHLRPPFAGSLQSSPRATWPFLRDRKYRVLGPAGHIVVLGGPESPCRLAQFFLLAPGIQTCLCIRPGLKPLPLGNCPSSSPPSEHDGPFKKKHQTSDFLGNIRIILIVPIVPTYFQELGSVSLSCHLLCHVTEPCNVLQVRTFTCSWHLPFVRSALCIATQRSMCKNSIVLTLL